MKVITIIHTIMIYGYIRVSSDKQTVENQRFEISNFCKRLDRGNYQRHKEP